jgi:hypothetical protein
MTTSTIEGSQRKADKVAGFTFPSAIAIVVRANYGINYRLIVPGNAVDTARNDWIEGSLTIQADAGRQ